MSLAEQRDVHEQIKSHFVEKPYLFQLPAPIWAVFQLRCPLTWKNSSFYFPKHSLINSSLLHMVSFLSPRLFLLSFPGASHSLLGDTIREKANRIIKLRQMLPDSKTKSKIQPSLSRKTDPINNNMMLLIHPLLYTL